MREYPRRTKRALIRYRRTEGFHHPRQTCPVYLLMVRRWHFLLNARASIRRPLSPHGLTWCDGCCFMDDFMGWPHAMECWWWFAVPTLQKAGYWNHIRRIIRRTQVTPKRSRLYQSKAPNQKRSSCLPWTTLTWVVKVKQPWTKWNRTNRRHDLEL
jgi:hypothetical protein